MSQMRILSANRCEAERANWALRDSVLRLEEELTFAKLQLSKVTNEFDMLVLLVKRAWSGDSMACIQVAKLIGLASPDYRIQSSSGQMIVKMKPKSRPLNNWAKLTTGLLSNVSKSEKAARSENQLLYLSQRQTYLTEQMTVDEIAKRPTIPRSRSSSFSDLRGQAQATKLQSMTGKTDKSITRRPSCGHLYRPTSHKTNLKEDQTCSEDSSLNKVGLFELNDLLVTVDPTQRPPTGLRQRVRSSFQDKPRGSVYAKGERPLKYETTRPVSTHQVKDKSRAQSAKPSTLKLRELFRQNSEFDDEVRAEDLEEIVEWKRNVSPISTISNDDEEETVAKTENPEIKKIRNRIKKLDSVIELDKELNSMARKEDDFRRKAVELQKRLGIDIDGMVV